MDSFMKFFTSLEPVAYWIIGAIIVIFFMAVIISLSLRRKYSSLSHELEEAKNGGKSPFVSLNLQSIVEQYKKVSVINKGEVNTQAIIEEQFGISMRKAMLGERFSKNAVSLMIILGLFGTFLGLTLAVGELANLLTVSEGSDWLDILNSVGGGLLFSLQGMAVAFVTSLFGIGCSILLTVLNIIINIQGSRESVMVEIESYLDNYIAVDVAQELETEYDVLAKVLHKSLQDFGSNIEESLRSAMEGVTHSMTEAAAGMGDTTTSLDGAIEKFDNSLRTFGENIRDFSEFNINLRNNIERMDVNFIKVTEAFQERKDKEITMIKMARKLGEIEKLLQKNTTVE